MAAGRDELTIEGSPNSGYQAPAALDVDDLGQKADAECRLYCGGRKQVCRVCNLAEWVWTTFDCNANRT